MLHSPGIQVESGFLFETPEEMTARVFRAFRPRTDVPAVKVLFRKFANVNSNIQFHRGLLTIKISDLLEAAPAHVLEALIYILIGKMFRAEVPAQFQHRYKIYVNQPEFRLGVHAVRQQRGRKVIYAPRGHHFDLDQIFDALNTRFFDGHLPKPTIGWSQGRSRTTLGHYDAAHNVIVLSRILDGAQVPPLAVEYVMYHEMLHVKFPTQHRGTRRCVHTKDFKAAEKLYPHFTEAEAILKKLSWYVD